MDELKKIAHIETDFETKFGVPRQSGLVKGLKGRIVFEPEYRNVEAFRGLEGFSHIWLLWDFSENPVAKGSKVRPPKLGGSVHRGIFATRSPFRPNNIGLSSVKLERIERDEKLGCVLVVSGVDMLDNTPIYDIKPYLPHIDIHSDATGGFAQEVAKTVPVEISDSITSELPDNILASIKELLAQDPRPAYEKNQTREYTVRYADYDISFFFDKKIIKVTKIIKLTDD